LLAAGSDSTLITSSESLDVATGGVHGGDTAFMGIYGDRVEYIYFPFGQIPPAGPYQVGVEGYYDSRWTVTVVWFDVVLGTVEMSEVSAAFEVMIPLFDLNNPFVFDLSNPFILPPMETITPSDAPSTSPSLTPCDCGEGAICGDDGKCIFALRFILSWSGTGMFC
jgi:hypothetical protein